MSWLNKLLTLTILASFGLAVFNMPQGRLAFATEFTSPSFKILNPVLDTGGIANSTSSSFLQLGAQGQLSIGFSTSGGFVLKSGFLYFGAPAVSPPPPPPPPPPSPDGGVILPFPFSPIGPYYDLLTRLFRPRTPKPFCADLNHDGIVGLVDASIMFFDWFDFDAQLAGLVWRGDRADCNSDSLVDILDLSIMLFWWDED